MARADSSPKAIVKAAIRTKCHVVARRYEHQRLERLHGSNVKWLVLSDELFEEVCADFTIRKLDLSRPAKRALFDAEWVSQVTYELITKPARPRRGRQQHGDDGSGSQPTSPCLESDARRSSSQTVDSMSTPSRHGSQTGPYEPFNDMPYRNGRHDSIMCMDPALLPQSSIKTSPTISPGSPPASRPRWFDTVLN